MIDMFHNARSWAVIASWPAPNSQPAASFGASRNGPSPLRNNGCASFGPSGPRSKSVTDVIFNGVKMRCCRNCISVTPETRSTIDAAIT